MFIIPLSWAEGVFTRRSLATLSFPNAHLPAPYVPLNCPFGPHTPLNCTSALMDPPKLTLCPPPPCLGNPCVGSYMRTRNPWILHKKICTRCEHSPYWCLYCLGRGGGIYRKGEGGICMCCMGMMWIWIWEGLSSKVRGERKEWEGVCCVFYGNNIHGWGGEYSLLYVDEPHLDLNG